MDTRLYNQNLSADLKLFQNLVEAKTLNKPFRTPKGPKKFSVYVKNEKGNVVKVNFGDPNMEIKRDDPNRRKNFRARHNCDNPGPKTKARYWSCKMWEAKKSVTDYTKGSDDSWDGETLYDHKVLLSLNPILAKAEEIKEEPEEKEDDCCGCGGCEEAVAAKRSGPRSAAQTPSKPSERRKGSSKNKKGSAGKGGPSITFSDDTDTGIFRSGSGLLSISANGVKVATFPTSAGSNGQVLSTNGSGVLSFVDQSGGGAVGGGSDKVIIENGTTITTNYTIGTAFGSTCNAGSFGPITINAGVTLTIPSGSVYTVV